MITLRLATRGSTLALTLPMVTLLAAWSRVSYAGEIKFSTVALPVDDSGKITDEGRKLAVDNLPSTPGEETWPMHLWAKLDHGGPGPLAIEFHGKMPDGKPYLVYREAHEDYDGGKYASLELDVEGNDGFNKGYHYQVYITQLDQHGREIRLASGEVTLIWTPAPATDDQPKASEPSTTARISPQSEATPVPTPTNGPPPVSAKPSGCSIPNSAPPSFNVFLVAGLTAMYRRRRARSNEPSNSTVTAKRRDV